MAPAPHLASCDSADQASPLLEWFWRGNDQHYHCFLKSVRNLVQFAEHHCPTCLLQQGSTRPPGNGVLMFAPQNGSRYAYALNTCKHDQVRK